MQPPNVEVYSVPNNSRSSTSVRLASTKACTFFSLPSSRLFRFLSLVPEILKIGVFLPMTTEQIAIFFL